MSELPDHLSALPDQNNSNNNNNKNTWVTSHLFQSKQCKIIFVQMILLLMPTLVYIDEI